MNRPKRSISKQNYAESDSAHITTESDQITSAGQISTPDCTNMSSNNITTPQSSNQDDNNLINLDELDEDDTNNSNSNLNSPDDTQSPQEFIHGDENNKENVINPATIPESNNNTEFEEYSNKNPKIQKIKKR